jgi:hypothetical protein
VQGTGWDWKVNEKDNGRKYFNFIDRVSGHKYKGRIENIHKSLISHTRVPYDFENYSRFNTRNLITCLETGASNFYFRDCKAPLSDRLARFLIKSRAGIQFTPKRKQDILGSELLRQELKGPKQGAAMMNGNGETVNSPSPETCCWTHGVWIQVRFRTERGAGGPHLRLPCNPFTI